MINITDINTKEEPYSSFFKVYKKALSSNQKSIEAICISSLNKTSNEVESRMVNLKYITNDEWIFFTNYNSEKAKNFKYHSQVSALFFWESINAQIRIKATIRKSPIEISDKHFAIRSKDKNALAYISCQSKKITAISSLEQKHKQLLKQKDLTIIRPDYWGGYSFTPYYFEFWHGHDARLNRREVYEFSEGKWENYFLQP